MLDLYTPPAITMSTREIADLIGKRHDHIKVSADRLASKGIIGTPATREFNHNGNTYTEYLLCKRDSLILVAQNCPEFTAQIVDRWQELEAQAAKPAQPAPFNPADLTRMDILKLAMESEEARLKAEARLALQQPLVDAAVRLAKSDNTYCLTEAAKVLKVTRQFLIDLMHLSKWIYRRTPKSDWLASDVKRHAGYLEHGYTHIETSNGAAFDKAQVRVTERGMITLASMCNTMQGQLALAV